MYRILLLCTLAGLMSAEMATFTNYKVFRIIPTTQVQVEKLRKLENSNEYSFWEIPSFKGRDVDIMVPPHKLPEFHQLMVQIGAPYYTYIQNVQDLVDQTMPKAFSNLNFNFSSYHTLEEIYQNLDDLVKEFPNKAQIIVGGSTYQGRQIKGIKLTFKPNNPGIFLEGGIHAREWISPAVVMYILHQLLRSNDKEIRDLAESHNWYIFPSFNPDGYVYTHTNNRMWRKSLKPYNGCIGADLNRNWDFKWNTGGASSNPCSETYAGSKPFSDIEAKSMSEYIKSIADKFYAYISVHSYSQLLMFPYGYTEELLENHEDEMAIGVESINALRKRYGTSYVTGNIAKTIYIASGSTIDYIKGVYKKPITFIYELRDTGRYGFLLPPEQILPTGLETMDSLIAMFKEAKKRGYPN